MIVHQLILHVRVGGSEPFAPFASPAGGTQRFTSPTIYAASSCIVYYTLYHRSGHTPGPGVATVPLPPPQCRGSKCTMLPSVIRSPLRPLPWG